MDGEVFQRAIDYPDVELARHDLSSSRDPVQEAREISASIQRTPMPFSGPLFKFASVRTRVDEFHLFACCHHIVIDGSGLAIRVASVYSAIVSGAPIPPAFFGSLQDLVDCELEYEASNDYLEDQAYWTRNLPPEGRPNYRMFSPCVQALASPATTTSSTVRHVEIFMRVLALSIAALTAVRFMARRPTAGANMSTLVPDSNTPTPISRLLAPGRDRRQDVATEGGSAVRRPLGRAHHAWENGSLGVTLVIGFWAGPPPSLVIPVLATILASGAAIGAQISATTVFVVAALAVVGMILVINLAATTKTRAVLRPLHDWVRARRRQILVAIFAVVGVTLVAQGMAS